MKFLDRVGLVIFSTIVLIISILLMLMGFNFIEPTIFTTLINKILSNQQATYILIGVSVVLILLAIRCLFFSDSGSKTKSSETGILLENSSGKLLITRNTLIDLVDEVVEKNDEVQKYDTDVIIDKQNNVTINVAIEVNVGCVIKELSSKLQKDIKENIKNATDLDVSAVDIEIHKVELKKEETENE